MCRNNVRIWKNNTSKVFIYLACDLKKKIYLCAFSFVSLDKYFLSSYGVVSVAAFFCALPKF